MPELLVNSLCMREISWQATDQGCQGRIRRMKSSPHTYGCLYNTGLSSIATTICFHYIYIYECFVGCFVLLLFALLVIPEDIIGRGALFAVNYIA